MAEVTLTDNWWFQLINMPILIVFFFVLNEYVFRRATEICIWFTFISLISIPIYVKFFPVDWIQLVTLISLCIIVLLINIYRYSHHKSDYVKNKRLASVKLYKWSILHFRFEPFVIRLIYLLCILDLLLTSIKELTNQFHWNAVCGLFLCFTFPIPSSKLEKPFWYIDEMNIKHNRRNDFIIKFNIGWIIAYTSWSACYIYASYFNSFIRGLTLLLIPLIPMFSNYKSGILLWFQARIYTLWFYYIFKIFTNNSLSYLMYCTDDWRLISDNSHHDLIIIWGLINSIISFIQFIAYIFSLTKMTISSKQQLNNMMKQQIVVDDINDNNNDKDKDIASYSKDIINADESEPLSPSPH